MSRFEVYYNGFLGINENDIKNPMVVECEYRDMPLNQRFFYPIIVSKFDSYMLCSSSNQFIRICKDIFDGTIESIGNILEIMNMDASSYRIRKMRRYSIEDSSKIYDSIADILTEDTIRKVNFTAIIDKEKYIQKKQNILHDQRQFVVLRDNSIASTAFISDIYNNGCNIVVYTDPNYRQKGYGKEVVKACINWCQANNLLPIYLVEEGNLSSIKLAESLELDLKSLEYIISQ